MTALIAQVYLAKEPGATILYDLRSSRAVPETITRLGGKAIRSRVGHAFIKAGMREHDAIFAGELSGHFYFSDAGFTDNAMFAMIQMLNLLALKKTPVSALIAPLRKYSATGEINMEVADKEAIYRPWRTRTGTGRQDHLDGLTVDYDSWWFNLRASNTEPLMRLNLEAAGPDEMESRKDEVLDAHPPGRSRPCGSRHSRAAAAAGGHAPPSWAQDQNPAEDHLAFHLASPSIPQGNAQAGHECGPPQILPTASRPST